MTNQTPAATPEETAPATATAPDYADPHEYDHKHANVSNGWLRAVVFGAMDGLVSNTGLVAGISGAGANPAIIIITGLSGMVAGGISMALGEYTSVKTSNEQLDAEVRVESEALQRNPIGEERELAQSFVELGMSAKTAEYAAREVHQNHESALRLHLSNEMGLSLDERPSPTLAAWSSFVSFGLGALIPVLPFLLGLVSIWWGLLFGGAGLIIAGMFAAKFTGQKMLFGGVRQLIMGSLAVGATYLIGTLLGVSGI